DDAADRRHARLLLGHRNSSVLRTPRYRVGRDYAKPGSLDATTQQGSPMDRQPTTHRAGYISETPVVFYDTLVPTKATGRPIVMIHGGAHAASCYLVTADGRPGWAYEFA